jgi:hypothetical protein
MLPPANTAFLGVPSPSRNRSPIAWLLAVVRCLFFLWLAAGIPRILPIFATLFAGIGVHVPWPTRVLLSSGSWFLIAAFAVGAMLVLAKTSVKFSSLQLRVVNVVLILIGGGLPLLIVLLMYLPLFMLIGKLKGAH